MSDTTTFKVAQVTAIVSSAFASGGILTLSFLTVPALLLPAPCLPGSRKPSSTTPTASPSQITQQWLWVYNKGKIIFPSLAATSALAYSYLAYALGGGRSDRLSRLYLTAAVATIAIVPYTFGVMLPTNKRLETRATCDDWGFEETEQESPELREEAKAKRENEDREIPALMAKWVKLNAVRGLFPFIGAVIGATAASLLGEKQRIVIVI